MEISTSKYFRCSGRTLVITGEFIPGWPGSWDEPQSDACVLPEEVTDEDGCETEMTDAELAEWEGVDFSRAYREE